MNIKKVIEGLKKANPEWNGKYDYDAEEKWLKLDNTNISDLTPLKGMPLRWLWLAGTPAAEKPLPDWLDGVQVYGLKGRKMNNRESYTVSTTRLDTNVVIGFFTFTALIIVLIIICSYFWAGQRSTASYRAWCKVTGNVKDLTQDEWEGMTSRTRRMLIKKGK